MDDRETARAWLRRKLEAARSDGCSYAPDVVLPCCLDHDRRYRGELRDVKTRKEADDRLYQCILEQGARDGPLWQLVFWRPLALTYWLAVRTFGWAAWRPRENEED